MSNSLDFYKEAVLQAREGVDTGSVGNILASLACSSLVIGDELRQLNRTMEQLLGQLKRS